VLSSAERQLLARWKIRYDVERFLEGKGFSTAEARRLMFARWLARRGAIGG
jgi:hypothetical protein